MKNVEDKLNEKISNLSGNMIILGEKLEAIDRLLKLIYQDMEDISKLLLEDLKSKGFNVFMVHVSYKEAEREYKILICLGDKADSDLEKVCSINKVKNYIKTKYPELIPYVEVRI